MAKPNPTDERLVFKFDIEIMASKVVKVLNVKKRIAEILGIKPSALQLFSVEEGCMVVTFLTPVFVADAIIPADGQLTAKQRKDSVP